MLDIETPTILATPTDRRARYAQAAGRAKRILRPYQLAVLKRLRKQRKRLDDLDARLWGRLHARDLIVHAAYYASAPF